MHRSPERLVAFHNILINLWISCSNRILSRLSKLWSVYKWSSYCFSFVLVSKKSRSSLISVESAPTARDVEERTSSTKDVIRRTDRNGSRFQPTWFLKRGLGLARHTHDWRLLYWFELWLWQWNSIFSNGLSNLSWCSSNTTLWMNEWITSTACCWWIVVPDRVETT